MYGHPTSEDFTHQTSAPPCTEFDFMDLVTRLSQGCDSFKNKVVTTLYNLDFFAWDIVMYFNYFETVSIVTFLHSLMELISGMFLFNTVLLYMIKYNICSAWFLDIVTSTCFNLIAHNIY